MNMNYDLFIYLSIATGAEYGSRLMIKSILLEQVGKQESSFLHRNRHHHLEALLRLVLRELEQP